MPMKILTEGSNIRLPNVWKKWNPNICNREIYLNFKDPIDKLKAKMVSRIGSPSADAEVYHVQVKDDQGKKTDFALKLMPHIDDDSEQKNKEEIKIAQQAGKIAKHFPMVFGHGTSNNIVSNDSPLFKKAKEYKCYNSLLSHISTKRQKLQFKQKYKEGGELLELVKMFNLDECHDDTIKTDYLISELTNGDLGNWMKKSRSLFDWKTVLFDIISGIFYMAAKLKKAHTDLHPGNILIIEPTDECNVTALLHDFGRTIDVTDDVPITNITGLLSFCHEFLGASKREDLIVPSKIKTTVRKVYDILSKLGADDLNTKKKVHDIYKTALEIINAVNELKIKRRPHSRGKRIRKKSRKSRRRKSV